MSNISPLRILYLVLKVIFAFPTHLIWNLIRVGLTARQRGLPLREYIVVAFSRNFMFTFEPNLFSTILPGTATAFANWRQSKKVSLPGSSSDPITTTLDDGVTKIHWIRGSQPLTTAARTFPRRVLLFFHGGGYFAPCTPPYLDWLYQTSQHFQQRDLHVDIALVEYQLTPHHQYPTQLRQARNALAHVLDHERVSPINIVIGGDSAGGNLTLALISHLLHAHPDIEPIKLKQALAGAFLVSPWLTPDQSTTSFRENAAIDVLTANRLAQAVAIFSNNNQPTKQQQQHHPWMWALPNETTWWNGLEHRISNLFLNVGDQELFRDHIVEFAQMLKHHPNISPHARSKIELDVGVGEAHVHITTMILAGGETNPPLNRLHAWLDKVWSH